MKTNIDVDDALIAHALQATIAPPELDSVRHPAITYLEGLDESGVQEISILSSKGIDEIAERRVG